MGTHTARHRRSRPRVWALLAGAVLLAAAATTATAAPATKLALASGRIHYQLSGTTKGTMVLSWIQSGVKFRQEMKMTATVPQAGSGTRPISVSTWTLSDGKNVYTLNPMVEKQVLRMKVLRTGPQANNVAAGLGGMFGQAFDPAKAKRVGKGKVLGRTCEISDLDTARVWVWQGLPLRIETKPGAPGPVMKMLATKVETAPKLSPALFKVPAGYQVRDFDPNAAMHGGMSPGGPPPRR